MASESLRSIGQSLNGGGFWVGGIGVSASVVGRALGNNRPSAPPIIPHGVRLALSAFAV
ncbi:hypothetical protein [Pseudomonas entomophila]|uniref:hypothetical protein n=1 Tax=Pseudomonas entomophila TaxID=312306 RepID=UPI003EB8AAD4